MSRSFVAFGTAPLRLPVKNSVSRSASREPEVRQIEHPRARALHQAQRIDLGDQVAAVGADLHQPRHRRLFFTCTARSKDSRRFLSRGARFSVLERVEKRAPSGRERPGRAQVFRVEALYIRRVAA